MTLRAQIFRRLQHIDAVSWCKQHIASLLQSCVKFSSWICFLASSDFEEVRIHGVQIRPIHYRIQMKNVAEKRMINIQFLKDVLQEKDNSTL